MDGPMIPSHLFSAHCSDGSIVSKHWRRRQWDGCQTVENLVGLRPVLLLDGGHRGVMEQMATLHLHATVEMTDVPRIVEDALDRVDRARSAKALQCRACGDGTAGPRLHPRKFWFSEMLAKAKLAGEESTTNEVHVRTAPLHRPTMLGRHGPHIVPPCWPLESEPLHFCLSSHASSTDRPPTIVTRARGWNAFFTANGTSPCARKAASLVCLRGNLPGAPASRGVVWMGFQRYPQPTGPGRLGTYLHLQWGQSIVLAALSSDLDPPTWFDCRRPSQARIPTSSNSRRGNGPLSRRRRPMWKYPQSLVGTRICLCDYFSRFLASSGPPRPPPPPPSSRCMAAGLACCTC